MFLLVPAYPGIPGPKGVKWLVCVCVCVFTVGREMPPKLPLSLGGDLGPHVTYGSFRPPTSTAHMANHFSTAHGHDQQTDHSVMVAIAESIFAIRSPLCRYNLA